MVSILPEATDQKVFPTYIPTPEEMKKAMRIHPRIQEMLHHRSPYVPMIKRAILNYEGIARENPEDPRDEVIVWPMARTFVESKTAEETKAMPDYVFTAMEDSQDSWKVELLKDVNEYVKRRINMKGIKHQMLRQKNLTGVGIARLGYRRVMGLRKIRVEDDETGIGYTFKEREVPVYDDLFMEVVPTLDFAVDPNATSMADAMDCVHFHAENYDVFLEVYGNDKRFKNIGKVQPGKGFQFNADGTITPINTDGKRMVGIWEYFNKIRDEWVIYANGVQITPDDFPLPDDHKMLPFVSYHNQPSFVTVYVNYQFAGQRSPNTGREIGYQQSIASHESFWTKGDPEIMRDLIELYTGFTRALSRNAKLAGESIVATAGNFRFAEKNWRTGDQAVGAMGKFQVVPLAQTATGNFEFILDKMYQAMVQVTGVDPRNLAEDKPQRTATEASIMRETAMKRLQQNIDQNAEIGETRMGEIIFKLIQQYYTKPHIIRLSGYESDKELKTFDDVEIDPDTGKPFIGKTYRRIPSKENLVESQQRGKYKMDSDHVGVKSFISRPEYIRTSDVYITVDSSNNDSQLKSIKLQQSNDAIQLALQLFQLAQPAGPGMEPLLSKDDLPNIKYAVEQHFKALGWNPEHAIGNKESKTDPEIKKLQESAAALAMPRPSVLPSQNAPQNELQGLPPSNMAPPIPQ